MRLPSVSCRFCLATTVPIIDFGEMPIANYFRKSHEPKSSKFRLTAHLCETCYLFQLQDQPIPTDMFNDSYPFFTGLSQNMREHFRLLVKQMLDLKMDSRDKFFIEIGCNDGTALTFLLQEGVSCLGIDPSKNVLDIAKQRGIPVLNDFFSNTLAQNIVSENREASHIFAANVICHIPDLRDLASGVITLLREDGVFVFEEPYLCDMLEKTSYDQIYDEHVYIFSITSVMRIFSECGLFLFDAEHQDTHGGSMRYFLSKDSNRVISARLKSFIEYENGFGVKDSETYFSFASKCLANRHEFTELLRDLKRAGHTIGGYAATSKSTTVLNFCGIGPELIDCIYDSTPEKNGCVTPGSMIPIKDQESLRNNPPDYLVLFAWNHRDEILKKERERLPKGQKWIFFVPKIEIFSE